MERKLNLESNIDGYNSIITENMNNSVTHETEASRYASLLGQ